MDETTTLVRGLLDTEHVLSYLLVFFVLGGGRWFVRQGWSDLLKYLYEREKVRLTAIQAEKEQNIEEARLNSDSRLAMAKQFEGLSKAFFELAGEVRQNNTIQQTIVNFLIHIFEKLNGQSVTEVLTEEVASRRG